MPCFLELLGRSAAAASRPKPPQLQGSTGSSSTGATENWARAKGETLGRPFGPRCYKISAALKSCRASSSRADYFFRHCWLLIARTHKRLSFLKRMAPEVYLWFFRKFCYLSIYIFFSEKIEIWGWKKKIIHHCGHLCIIIFYNECQEDSKRR